MYTASDIERSADGLCEDAAIRISVVVPTYNQIRTIEECLNGILAQRCAVPVEILIGDDGSNDGTFERCVEIMADSAFPYRVIQWSRKNHQSINGRPTVLSNAQGLFALAKGDFIAYCEGDDVWLNPQKLQWQLDAMTRNPKASICWTRTLMGNSMDRAKPTDELSPILNMADFQWRNVCGTMACTAFWKNSDAFKLGLDSAVLKTLPNWDWPLYLNCLQGGKVGLVLEETTAFYRMHEGGGYSGLDMIDRYAQYVQCLNAFHILFGDELDYTDMLARLERDKSRIWKKTVRFYLWTRFHRVRSRIKRM